MNYITVQRMRKQALLSKLFGADPKTKAFNKAVAKLKADLEAADYGRAKINADPEYGTIVEIDDNIYDAPADKDGNFNANHILEDHAFASTITPAQKQALANKFIDSVSKDYGGYDQMAKAWKATKPREHYVKALAENMRTHSFRGYDKNKPFLHYNMVGEDLLTGHDLSAEVSPQLKLLTRVAMNG